LAWDLVLSLAEGLARFRIMRVKLILLRKLPSRDVLMTIILELKEF
jgi:hypothetical protein